MIAPTLARPPSTVRFPRRLKLKASARPETRLVLSSPRDVHARPPIARMVRIHHRLCPTAAPGWEECVNTSTLAGELECDPKTIQRDVEFMRDALELPIDYDASLKSFFYTRPVNVIFGLDPSMDPGGEA